MTTVPASTTSKQNQLVLKKAANWFKDKIVANHVVNTKKLVEASSFNLNPMLLPYLSVYLNGEVTPEGIARSLIYPRVLGTSITTSFGTNIQSFISDVLADTYGSISEGIDIEFDDKIDGVHKYAQVKLGPNCINKDDVETINNHFRKLRGRARVNKLKLTNTSLVVGVMYGDDAQLSGFYRRLNDHYDYPVYVGADFWHRLTGDQQFFGKLAQVISSTLNQESRSELLEATIKKLARDPQIVALSSLARPVIES